MSRSNRALKNLVSLIASVCICTNVLAEEQAKPVMTIGDLSASAPSFSLSAFDEARLVWVPMNRRFPFFYMGPLPQNVGDLPDVLTLYIGPFSDDLEHAVDKELIQPLDTFFKQAGLFPTDFLPNAIQATAYRGKIWAIPHQMSVRVLIYDETIFKRLSLEPKFSSWEELFEAAARISKIQECTGFLVNIAPLDLCEIIANTVGSQVFSLSDPSLLKSERLFKAYSLVEKYRANGAIKFKVDYDFFRLGLPVGTTGIALVPSYSLPSHDSHGALDMPTRLLKTDPPNQGWTMPALLRCFALKKNTPGKTELAFQFLKWLMSEENQMRMVRDSSLTVLPSKRPGLLVHVPLIKPVITSRRFQEVLSKNPDYAVLLRTCKAAYFPRHDPKLYREAHELANNIIESDAPTRGLRDALNRAYGAVVDLTRKARVGSGEFDEY